MHRGAVVKRPGHREVEIVVGVKCRVLAGSGAEGDCYGPEAIGGGTWSLVEGGETDAAGSRMSPGTSAVARGRCVAVQVN